MHSTDTVQRGFTLLELSIVLVLIGIILAGGLVTLSAYLQAAQVNTTVARMDMIENALLDFAVAFNRIPCPSDLTLPPSSPYYGMEAGAGSGSAIAIGTGACTGTGMVPQATFSASSGAVEGGVPTRALQLPDDDMYDAWGRRFSYAVDPTATQTDALPIQAGSNWCGDPITVDDASGSPRTTNAIYAIISHGADGHGAYTSNGVMMNAGSDNANELTNCHCTGAGVPDTTYIPTYVEMMPTTDPSDSSDNFDDIVTFKEAWQMQTPNFPLATTASSDAGMCIYVVASHQVSQYNSNGILLRQIGSYGDPPASGQYLYAERLAIDAYGNLWVTDQSGCYLNEFTSGGTFIARYGSWGTSGLGKFGNMVGVAVDRFGNVWVADSDYRVQMWSAASKKWVGQVGCNGTNPCASGSGNGEFGDLSDSGITFDTSGNLWVADTFNYRVQEFTINYNNVTGGSGGNVNMGTWVQTVGGGASCTGCTSTTSCTCTSGTSNGLFSFPTDMKLNGANLWVVDNERLDEFTISSNASTYVKTVGGYGSGNGQFNYVTSMAFDPLGNIWVNDDDNGRVQEFNGSGTYISKFGATGGWGIGVSR